MTEALEASTRACILVSMSDEQDKLKRQVEQAEAAVARAQKVYDEAEPSSHKDLFLQLLLAEGKLLQQLRNVMRQHAATGDNLCCTFWGL